MFPKSNLPPINQTIEWRYEGDALPAWDVNENEDFNRRLIEAGAVRISSAGKPILRFVGILLHGDKTIVCLPKVRVHEANEVLHDQVMRALRTYSKWRPSHHEASPHLNSDPANGALSAMAATQWLIDDYLIHGLHRREIVEFERNGRGRTHWGKTIAGTAPIISRGTPIYPSTVTRRSQADPNNFPTMLHLYLLETLSSIFGPLLGYEKLTFNHETVQRFQVAPSLSECKARLNAEMRITFSERSLELLPIMLATLQAMEIEQSRSLSLYGTRSFHHIWESACGTVFGNDVDHWKAVLPKPIWTSSEGASQTADTFIPDLVTQLRNDPAELLLADAKYFRPQMPPRLAMQPGVNDVAKQIWYKQHLEPLAQNEGYTAIHNVFLFPGNCGKMTKMGRVEFPLGGERVDAVMLDFMGTLARYADRTGPEHRESLKALIDLLDTPTAQVGE